MIFFFRSCYTTRLNQKSGKRELKTTEEANQKCSASPQFKFDWIVIEISIEIETEQYKKSKALSQFRVCVLQSQVIRFPKGPLRGTAFESRGGCQSKHLRS